MQTLSSGWEGYIPSGIGELVTRRDLRLCGRCHQIVSGTERVNCN